MAPKKQSVNPLMNPLMYSGDPARPALGNYLHALGDRHGHQMCQALGIPLDVIKNIECGHPVAAIHVQRIAEWLSQQYQRDIGPADIANVFAINPGRDLPPVTSQDLSSDGAGRG